jgi:ubiquinone/menaquinone biosynthesis C-methylase UbiE
MALRRLLPSYPGSRLLEIGAGFGRLSQEYKSYQQVVLLDYSFSQLQYAREKLGSDPRFIYVAANAYHLPFQPGSFAAAAMVRVLHHFSDVPGLFREVGRILKPGGSFLLEYANKRNLKAMLRYALKQQTWDPYSLEPVEFLELNYDFHPQYIQQELEKANFHLQQQIPVSFLRLAWVKRWVPLSLLVALDRGLQASSLLYSPSIFSLSLFQGSSSDQTQGDLKQLFMCPETGSALQQREDTLVNEDGIPRYQIRDGIYDFKTGLA